MDEEKYTYSDSKGRCISSSITVNGIWVWESHVDRGPVWLFTHYQWNKLPAWKRIRATQVILHHVYKKPKETTMKELLLFLPSSRYVMKNAKPHEQIFSPKFYRSGWHFCFYLSQNDILKLLLCSYLCTVFLESLGCKFRAYALNFSMEYPVAQGNCALYVTILWHPKESLQKSRVIASNPPLALV